VSALSDALEGLPLEHQAILRWFSASEGQTGARPWRRGGESVVPGVTVPIVAQRGIHVPSGWPYAVSVTATSHSKYGDGHPALQGDGTWVLLYNAHRGGEGQGSGSRWNRALLRCSTDRVPVGVFLPSGSDYLNLGLAMVDEYFEEADTFVLHGPVRSELAAGLFDLNKEPDLAESWQESVGQLIAREEAPGIEPDERRRIQAEVVRRDRQSAFRDSLLRLYGRCAVTGYEAPQTLDAAHILRYRGVSSHTAANGLLLRADIHRLFDMHALSVEPETGRVKIGRNLESTRYAELNDRQLRLPQSREDWPSPQRLRLHFDVFAEVNS
jgi:putative restriction endonuclease